MQRLFTASSFSAPRPSECLTYGLVLLAHANRAGSLRVRRCSAEEITDRSRKMSSAGRQKFTGAVSLHDFTYAM
jgi:hypothetical protein